MRISSVKLFQIRRFSELSLSSFDNRLNVICGPNARGKTSILEALSVAMNLESFKTHRTSELIQEGCDQGLISVQLQHPTASRITVGLSGNKKSVRIDEKPVTSRSKYPYLGAGLTFSPDDLMIIKGGPELRRRWIDEFILSQDPQFAIHLQKYEKVLKQRNSLLKLLKEGRARFDELPLWTESLIEASYPLYRERLKAIELLNQRMPRIYQQLFNTSETVRLVYGHRFSAPLEASREVVEILMIEKLNSLLEAERSLGYTLVGPHKDDFEFLIDEREARTFGSQGQTRGLVIALRITQLEASRDTRSFSPLLLLDDIISELDDRRVHALMDYLSGYPGQMFVTTAEVNKVRALHELFPHFHVIDLAQNEPRSSDIDETSSSFELGL